MAQGVINVRIDEKAKQKFNLFCEENGISMSAAISLFISRVNNDWKIPFEIVGKRPNPETMAAMAEVEDMKKHPEKYKGYKDVDEMFKEILSADV